jgi:hypothetical protein
MKVFRFPWIYLVLVSVFGAICAWSNWQLSTLIEMQSKMEPYSEAWTLLEQELNDYRILFALNLLGALMAMVAMLIHGFLRFVRGQSNVLP